MTKKTVECTHVKKLIDDGIVKLLNKNYCAEFNEYVSSNIPWSENSFDRIDWDKYGQLKQVNVGEISFCPDKIHAFLKDSCLGQYDEIAVIYSARQPGTIAKFNVLCDKFWPLAAIHCPMSFLAGVTRDKYGIPVIHPEDFAEFWRFKTLLTVPDKKLKIAHNNG